MPRPPRVGRVLATWVRAHVRVPPLAVLLVKVLVVTPLLVCSLAPVAVVPARALTALFVALVLLDWLHATLVAHTEQRPLQRLFDRLTDLPLVAVAAWMSMAHVATLPLVLKLVLDGLVVALALTARGARDNRLRAALHYAVLWALLWLAEGRGSALLTVQTAEALLWANIAVSTIAVLYYLNVLQARFVADALSGANLLCGIFSMVFSARGRFEVSLLFVILGAALDGFDGAAARRFGGTRFGVYSDDIADGTNYGIAPAVALYYVFGANLTGLAIGVFYATMTLSRLLFFTLSKSGSDPNLFAGVPSPVGGLIAMSAIVVFREQPGLIGLMIGIAAAQMVSFSTPNMQVGRALAARPRARIGAPSYVLTLLVGLRWFGAKGAASVILGGNLVYGFIPPAILMVRAFKAAHRRRAERNGSGDERVQAPL